MAYTAISIRVYLIGLPTSNRRDFMQKSRRLKRAAVSETQALLQTVGQQQYIWSHAFQFEDGPYLLSAHVKPAREVGATTKTATERPCHFGKELAARLVIEVVPSPTGLSPRTIVRSSPLLPRRTAA